MLPYLELKMEKMDLRNSFAYCLLRHIKLRKTCKATDIIIYVTLYTINKISKPAEPGLIQGEGRVNI